MSLKEKEGRTVCIIYSKKGWCWLRGWLTDLGGGFIMFSDHFFRGKNIFIHVIVFKDQLISSRKYF